MISTIRSMIDFFRKERFYAFLFVALVAIYFSMRFAASSKPPRQDARNAPAVQEFRKAEEQFQNKIKKAGSITEYLKSHPELEIVFASLSVLLGTGLLAGLILDFMIFFKRGWHQQFSLHARPPGSVDWKFSMIFKVILLFIAGSYLTGFILGWVNRFVFPGGSGINLTMLLHTFIMDFLCMLFVLHVVRREGGSARDIGLGVPSGSVRRELAIGWGAYAAILPVFGLCLVLLISLAQIFHYEPDPHPLVNIFLEEEQRSPFLIGFSVFLAIAYGPVFEEIFFRGFCYPVFKKKLGILPAMSLSAAFFALIHANTFAFWPIFILGLALSWVFEKRGSLLPGIVLHVTHNAIFITYFFLAKKVIQHAGG